MAELMKLALKAVECIRTFVTVSVCLPSSWKYIKALWLQHSINFQ